MNQIIKTHKPTMRDFRRDQEAVPKLSPEQFRVTQRSGTERPGTGEYLHNAEPGIYVNVVSGEPLFASSDKFDSGSGWPSLTRPIDPPNVNEVRDTTHARDGGTISRSTHGDSHLGHVFSDGPQDQAVAIASTRRRFGSSIATTWRPRAMRPTRTRWRTSDD